jgi:hypothetical protein
MLVTCDRFDARQIIDVAGQFAAVALRRSCLRNAPFFACGSGSRWHSPPNMQGLLPTFRLALLLSFVALGCNNSDYCGAGEPCECSNTTDCYFGCDEDGCNPRCFQMNHCGAVCEDDCHSQCFDVQECSTSCGNDCSFECHNAVACGLECGANCDFDCHDAERCGAIVGDNSHVRCANFTSCEVECTGSCRVECVAPTSCQVTCQSGGPTQCSDGKVACGGC